MDENQIQLVLKTLKERTEKLMGKEEINYVSLFKESGERAGASLVHGHHQILGSRKIPRLIKREIKNFKNYYRKHKTCYLCQQISKPENLIVERSNFCIIAPWASMWPYESWIISKEHLPNFTQINLESLAKLVKQMLSKYGKLFGKFPYNLVYHSFPGEEKAHFFLKIIPRFKIQAGLEFLEFFVNEVPPKRAWKELRFE